MSRLEAYIKRIDEAQPVGVTGRVVGVRGLTVSVGGFPAPMGAGCRIARGSAGVDARVVGFAEDKTLVMPIGSMTGIGRGDRVVMTSARQTVNVCRQMLGRVLDGFGRPLDGGDAPPGEAQREIWPGPISPMQRARIDRPLATGVRALDATLTVGRGQRMGILSGSGVGKSALMGMIARGHDADVTVIALIGERGREVRDFIEKDLGDAGLKRSVVIVSTSDDPPLVRVQAGAVATTVAEYFRDCGCDVLLLMDSLTRLATAQRQMGLAAGEPPASRGYPPSVFALLPELLERAGRTHAGSITGFYSVLVEADDLADPISDAVRSVTDGHVFLSRKLAQRGQYPAVDLLRSISRVMGDVAEPQHIEAAMGIRKLLAIYEDVEDMLSVGAYQSGANSEYDLAIRWHGEIRRLLEQDRNDSAPFDRTRSELMELFRKIGTAPAGLDAVSADTPGLAAGKD